MDGAVSCWRLKSVRPLCILMPLPVPALSFLCFHPQSPFSWPHLSPNNCQLPEWTQWTSELPCSAQPDAIHSRSSGSWVLPIPLRLVLGCEPCVGYFMDIGLSGIDPSGYLLSLGIGVQNFLSDRLCQVGSQKQNWAFSWDAVSCNVLTLEL